jgi:hypothetical protein
MVPISSLVRPGFGPSRYLICDFKHFGCFVFETIEAVKISETADVWVSAIGNPISQKAGSRPNSDLIIVPSHPHLFGNLKSEMNEVL